jgi:tripartite-type tricarboxylate transporter receptor subunit TctC
MYYPLMMKHYRALAAGFLLAASMSAIAADASSSYPVKPVRVLVGLAPGGAVDIQARWFAQKLGAELGRQFVIDNRAGAGGLVAYQATTSANADGYTLLVVAPGLTIAPALDRPAIDPLKDLAPISLLTKAPFVIVVAPSLPPKNLPELIAYAKAKPKEFVMAASGRTAIHLGAVWLSYATKSNMTIITYKGANPALIDVLAGQAHATFVNVLSAVPHVKAGRLRAIAVTSLERTTSMPDVATVSESGIPDYDVTTWNGWAAPRGTPPTIVRRLNEALVRAAAAPDISQRLAEDGGTAVGSTPDAFRRHIADEIARWKTLVQVSGMRAD